MIALDTSVIVAMAAVEPEAEQFSLLVRGHDVVISWPTLFEVRMVLAGKRFANAPAIVEQLVALPNVTAIAFDANHYREAEKAFDRFGKGRHPAGLNMGDCFSYAVAAISRAPLLFKGRDFGKTDIKIHPRSVQA